VLEASRNELFNLDMPVVFEVEFIDEMTAGAFSSLSVIGDEIMVMSLIPILLESSDSDVVNISDQDGFLSNSVDFLLRNMFNFFLLNHRSFGAAFGVVAFVSAAAIDNFEYVLMSRIV
jgi:hypothetical protein